MSCQLRCVAMSEGNPFDVLYADPELLGLAEEINREHQKILGVCTNLTTALRAGELLCQAKKKLLEKLGHGHWMKWVKGNCDFSYRTAQIYRQTYQNWDKAAELNLQSSADLPTLSSIQSFLELIRKKIVEEEKNGHQEDGDEPKDELTEDEQIQKQEEEEFDKNLRQFHSALDRTVNLGQQIEKDFGPPEDVWSKDHKLLLEIRKKFVDLEALGDRILRGRRQSASH